MTGEEIVISAWVLGISHMKIEDSVSSTVFMKQRVFLCLLSLRISEKIMDILCTIVTH